MVVPSINPEDKVSLKYIIRQFLKCQKIFKGSTLRIFSRKFDNLRENIFFFQREDPLNISENIS